ncbi:hypothetical protein [Paenibacillus sp. A3M_27_13]|uniref:hypothetical protein n=1 Tax=Paenibacillus sp. A3M_27_13 TaxID=2962029 RepID=UPI0020B6DD67|nr:hypothetical protein [Paenibacillus sp. A3M_27_13]MCP3746772.1 hypothetical protein [Paenibacillus sp. A3M_27_13]
MILKDLFFLLLKKTKKIEIGHEKNELFQDIMLFVDRIKIEYSLGEFVSVQLNDELPINEGIAKFEDNICYVQIGARGCRERNELSEGEWATVKNTIVHELTHAKNKADLTQDTRKRLEDNMYSLAYFAMQLIDEFSAYKAADTRFIQIKIGSEETILQKAIKQVWFDEGFLQTSKYNNTKRYEHFYDICTAIIVHSIRNKEFPSIPEIDKGYNDMCIRMIDILREYESKMPLDFKDYEKSGNELWDALTIMVPDSLIRNFKINVGIRF